MLDGMKPQTWVLILLDGVEKASEHGDDSDSVHVRIAKDDGVMRFLLVFA